MGYIKTLFSFKGRTNRMTYWLTYLLLAAVAFIVQRGADKLSEPVAAILLLFVCVPILAVNVKRWHDRDKSAWWLLMHLVPLIGPIWILIECGFLRGTEGPNHYGSDPLTEG